MRVVARVGIALTLSLIAVMGIPAMAQAIVYIKAEDDIPVAETFGGPAGIAVSQTTGSLYAGYPLGPNFLPPGPPTGDGAERFNSAGASQGTFGSGLAAVGVAVAPDDAVYVLDAGLFDGVADINAFTATGIPVGSPIPVNFGTFEGQTPQIAAFNPGGPTFIAYPNAIDDVVDFFLPDGTAVGSINGADATAFVDPRGVAVTNDLTFYVVDTADGGRVVKLRPFVGDTGAVLEGTTGAVSVAVNPETGDVYVGQGNGAAFHIVVYDSTGAQIGDFGAGDFEDGNAFPRQIAVEASTKRVYVSDSGPTKRIVVYEEGAPPPVVTTMTPSNAQQTSATFSGTVAQSDIAPVTDCHFEYTTQADFDANGFANASDVPCAAQYPSNEAVLVLATANVTGLDPNTAYRVRLVATNSGGTSEGTDLPFETLPNPPIAVTGAPTQVRQVAATVGGSVDPNGGVVTECVVEYGTTAAYGQSRPCASHPGNGTEPAPVGATLRGLAPGTTYHYRVAAATEGGSAKGADQTFTTVPKPDPCVVSPKSCAATDPCVVTPLVCVMPGQGTVARLAAVKGGRALIVIDCKGAAGARCKGTLRLRAKVRPVGARRARSMAIGSRRYDVPAGVKTTVRISLRKAARRALARKGRLRARITGAGIVDRKIVLDR